MAQHVLAEVLIPGGSEPVARGAVVLEGAEITYAGKATDAPRRSSGDTVVEVPVLLPGLWDCHAHFIGMPSPDLQRLASQDPLTAAARAVGDAAALVEGGVTSVRDVGGMGLSLATAIEEGRIRGPRIHAAGAVLSTTGGHADIHSFSLDVVHAVTCSFGFSLLCDGVPEVLRAVRTNLRRGAKLIKVCASGGVMSEVDHPMHQQFSDEELAAIVQEAARSDRIVAAHCHGKAGIMAALRAGCHTIEHGSFLDEEAADLMVEKAAFLVPTRFVVSSLMGQLDTLPAYAAQKLQMVADAHEQAMKLAIAKGVRIAAGCDIFVSGGPYGSNSLEITHLINAGMSDLDAIDAATSNAPLTLGRQAPRSGRLVAGYDADCIALDANPLDDRSVWGEPSRVTHVWQRGAQVK